MNAKQKLRIIKYLKYRALLKCRFKSKRNMRESAQLGYAFMAHNAYRCGELLRYPQPHDEQTNKIRMRKIYNAHNWKKRPSNLVK